MEDNYDDLNCVIGDSTSNVMDFTGRVRYPQQQSVPAKTYINCEWCHGKTVTDSRGNCSACGAPREEEGEQNDHPFTSMEEWQKSLISWNT